MPDAVDQRDAVILSLKAAGMRVTSLRIAVLAALSGQPHATADELMVQAKAVLGSVSRQAVYDVLDACTRAGLTRRIEPAGSAARFETRTGDNHHHLVCRTCGAVEDVDCVVSARPCLTPSDDHGFSIDEAEVTFWGYCPTCTANPIHPTLLHPIPFPSANQNNQAPEEFNP